MKTVAKARVLVTRFPYESQLGGEEMHTLALMEALDKHGIEAFFLGSCPILLKAFKHRGFLVQKKWLHRPPVSSLSLLSFTLLSPLLFVFAGIYLWNAKRKWDVNVLYSLSFSEKLLMTPWAKLFGMKTLWLEHARIGNWLTKNPWRFVYRWFSKWSTVIVTSHAMEPLLRPYAKTVLSIPCGTLVEKHKGLPKEISDFLKGGFALGIVARLTVDKGVDKMVKLVHSKPDMRLVVIGKGPLLETLPQLKNHPQILWRESLPRPELMALYEALDLLLLPSMQMDPFGMVAAEAMWCGTPALVTDVCGIAMDMKKAKIGGIVATKFSSIDKEVKMLMKHSERLKSLAGQQKQFVRKHYAFKDMVKAFEVICLSSERC